MARAAARLLTRRIVGAGTARVSEAPPSAIFEAGGVSIAVRRLDGESLSEAAAN